MFVFFLLSGAILSGCGQTGPLYLPTENPPTPPVSATPDAETKDKALEKDKSLEKQEIKSDSSQGSGINQPTKKQ